MATDNKLRHVTSMLELPSAADQNSALHAVILGEALASEENDLVFPSDEFARQAHVSSPQQYLEMYKRSVEDPAGFWSDIASQFYWKKKWDQPACSENFDFRKGNISIQVFFVVFIIFISTFLLSFTHTNTHTHTHTNTYLYGDLIN